MYKGNSMRDHGGDLGRAKALYGGDDWIDLSTGINRQPYPLPALDPHLWTDLPHAQAQSDLLDAAARAYRTDAQIVALPGAQAAIQLVPRLRAAGKARVLSPSYNEHAGALQAQGWNVTPAPDLAAMRGAELAVVVNPNNPDGRAFAPEPLIDLAAQVGLLIVDESFADPHPHLSLAPHLGRLRNVVILRSFGKFYGLAGLRLGFALTSDTTLATHMQTLAGPWAVSGPAQAIGAQALRDTGWQDQTTARLQDDSARLASLGQSAGWGLVGRTALFCTFATPDAAAAQTRLARARIWSRLFPYSGTWLRLGLPGRADEWARLENALR
jgi:cobalamin biosynthesis protein CobC